MSDRLTDAVISIGRNPSATFEDVASLPKFALDEIGKQFGHPAHWPISIWGPFAGLLDGVCKHPEYHAWARWRTLAVNRIAVWSVLHILGVKKRPGYNDFLIMRWMLLGDEATALEMIERSKRPDSIGCTLCWALRSLCQQYDIFAARFAGLIPKANPADMLKDAPPDADPEQVLRRAEWIDKLRAE